MKNKLESITKSLEFVLIERATCDEVLSKFSDIGLDCSLDESPFTSAISNEHVINVISLLLSDDISVQDSIREDILWWMYDKPSGPSEVTFDDGTSIMVDDSAKSCANYLIFSELKREEKNEL